MLSVSSVSYGLSNSPVFANKAWLLSREKLELILSFFKKSNYAIENLEELQKFCFAKTIKACRKKEKYEKIIAASEHLFGLLDDRGRSIFQAVIEDANAEHAKLFLEKANEKDLRCLMHGDYKLALHFAARTNRHDLLEILWPITKRNKENSEGKTPLHIAIESGSIEFLSKLLEFRKRETSPHDYLGCVSLESRFEDKDTGLVLSPIALAVVKGEIQILDLLLAHVGNDKFLKEIVSGVGNLLHLAISFGRTEMLEHLLSKYFTAMSHLINDRESHPYSQTPLSLAAAHGDVEALLLMQRAGADLETVDCKRRTALHHAALGEKGDAIYLLILLGAKANPKDQFCKEPKQYIRNKTFFALNLKSFLINASEGQETSKNLPPNFYSYLPENLVFQGGGPKGIAYIGALDVLEKRGILSQVKRLAGTSAGAITAAFLALGYSIDEAKKHLMAMQIIEFLDFDGARLSQIIPETKHKIHELKRAEDFLTKVNAAIKLLGLLRFVPDFIEIFRQLKNQSGLCKGEVIRQWIARAVEQKTGDANLTFGELRGLINSRSPYKHLYVFTTKIGANKEIIQLDSENEKCNNFIIADAVRASLSLPGAFEAHTLHFKDSPGLSGRRCAYEGQSYIDGGVIYNFPVEVFDKKKYIKKCSLTEDEGECPSFNKRTLAFSLYNPGQEAPKEDTTITTSFDLFCEFAKARLQSASIIRKRTEYNKHRTININNLGVGTFEFDLSTEKMEELISSGQEAAEDFFEQQAKSSKLFTQTFFDTKNERLVSLIRKTNIKAPVNTQGRNGVTQLHTAVVNGDVKTIYELLQDPFIDVNIQDDHGNTPLHLFSMQSEIYAVKTFQLFLNHPETDINIQNKSGDTPIHKAYQRLGRAWIRMLHEQLLEKHSFFLKNELGNTVLHEAAACDHVGSINKLLENQLCDVNIQNCKGETPLHLSLNINVNDVSRSFSKLLEHPNVNVNLQDNSGRTVLHNIILKYERMRANLPPSDASIALLPPNEFLSKCLDKKLGESGRLFYLVQLRDFISLLKKPDINPNLKDNQGNAAIHLSFLELTQLLIPYGYNIPDHLIKNSMFARLLSHSKIDPNVQDKDGRTPLHLAAGFHHVQAASLLLNHPKIQTNIKDNAGNTPLHTAKLSKCKKICDVISEHIEVKEISKKQQEQKERSRKVANNENTPCFIS